MQDFMSKARPMRSVLQRTRARGELPALVLYVEWLSGERRGASSTRPARRTSWTDRVVQSHYRLVTGAQAREHIAKHWQAQVAAAAARGGAGGRPLTARRRARQRPCRGAPDLAGLHGEPPARQQARRAPAAAPVAQRTCPSRAMRPAADRVLSSPATCVADPGC